MKKVFLFPIVMGISLLVGISAPAESTLTTVDTVVYMSEEELTLEQALQRVAEAAALEVENGKAPAYTTVGSSSSSSGEETNSLGIRDVIKLR